MTPPVPPTSKIGEPVRFSPPLAVAGQPPRLGEIIDEVWSPVCYDACWGWYAYTSQLIKWDDPVHGKSIRITYYYQAVGAHTWLFGGQYAVEDEPSVINDLLRQTLAKKWQA